MSLPATSRTADRTAPRGGLRLRPVPPAEHDAIVTTAYGFRDFWIRRLLLLADTLGLMAALAASAAVAGRDDLGMHLVWGLAALPAWIAVFTLYGLYARDAKRVSHTSVDDIPWLFHALLLGSLLFWAFLDLVADEPPAVGEMLAFGAAALVLVFALRAVTRAVAARVLDPECALLVGEDQMTDVLVRKIQAHPEYGLRPVGVLTNAPDSSSSLPILGDLEALDDVVREHGIDRVVVASTSLLDAEDQLELLRRCRKLSLKVSFVPHVFDAMGPAIAVDDVEGVTLLGMNPPVLSRSSRILKRTLDLVGSGVVLVATAPLLALIAIAIRLDSRGPVIFRQERIGKDGRAFRLCKFRTMVEHAEDLTGELLARSKDPHWLLIDHDPRVTRIGRLLRTLSLDELPQLWNVLKGEMSLVGPRPMPRAQDELISDWGRARMNLTPGITGLWQVLGRTTISFEEMVKLDYLYVLNWSLWQDLRLLLRTFRTVVQRRGAN